MRKRILVIEIGFLEKIFGNWNHFEKSQDEQSDSSPR